MNWKLLLLVVTWLLGIAPSQAEQTRITAPTTQNGTHAYFHELLIAAFAATGREVVIEEVKDPARLRMKKMLASGELTIMWMTQSPQNDSDFVRIDFPLTDGLSGQRVLMIRPQDQERFDRINSLDDLRRSGLVAGLGPEGVDFALWQANGLPAITPATDPGRLYDMLRAGNRGVDYIPHSVNGIMADTPIHRGLVPEQHLLLHFNREGRFYLSPIAADLRPTLEAGLKIVRSNGTLARLVEKHMGHIRRALNLDRRLVLSLRDDEKLN